MIEVAPYTHSLQSQDNATELFSNFKSYFHITPERRAAYAPVLRQASEEARNWPAQT
jgi:hypothetical protein